MQDLIVQLVQNGLTPQQADRCLQVIHQWLDSHYPVAGALTGSWLQQGQEALPPDQL